MALHTDRARSTEKPLTAKALNAFFETAAAGLEKAGFREQTTQDALSEVAGKMLPVSDPIPGHEAIGYVLSASRELADFDHARSHNTLPETLTDLKVRIEELNIHFDEEPLSRRNAARNRFKEILQRAYEAAEKDMGRGSAASL